MQMQTASLSLTDSLSAAIKRFALFSTPYPHQQRRQQLQEQVRKQRLSLLESNLPA